MDGKDFVSGRDDRGHLIPERSAAQQDAVNVPENVISEHGTQSNRSVKKRWENQARKKAADNPDSWSVHEPNYDGPDSTRPSSVDHNMYDGNGKPIDGMQQTIDNPE